MIRSSAAQRSLAFASAHLSRGPWRLLHEGMRRIYLGPVISLLNRTLRPPRLPSRAMRVSARHSATSAPDFNFFLSDLDLKVVLADDRIGAASEIVARYQKQKEALPFLGELEIYSESEWIELTEFLNRFPGLYSFIRNLRKLSWMEEAQKTAFSEYHRMKAKRAASKILEQGGRAELSVRTARWLEKELGSIIPSSGETTEDFSIFSDYLATTLTSASSPEPEPATGVLTLPERMAHALLALTPRIRFGSARADLEIERLRRLPAVRERWATISRIECLIFQAVLRAQPSASEADREWLQLFRESSSAAMTSSGSG